MVSGRGLVNRAGHGEHRTFTTLRKRLSGAIDIQEVFSRQFKMRCKEEENFWFIPVAPSSFPFSFSFP